MPATAIDIGTYSIKALAGKPGPNLKIDSYAESLNTLDLAVPHDDPKAEQLMDLLDNFINDNNLPKSDVRLSLPEEVVSTKVIEMPSLSSAELASAINWQAEQHIPIPQDELTLEYQVLFKPPKRSKEQQMRVLLVGTRKSLVERYTNIFLNLGIQPKILETHIFSIIRALGFSQEDPTSMIIHIGASNMQMAVVANAELILALNHRGGGTLLTKTLQQGIENLDPNQAEQYKRTYGISGEQLQGKIRDILMPSINSLTQQIIKTVRYHDNQNPSSQIRRLVLSGGTAQLPGFLEHLSSTSNLEAVLAAPFATSKGKIPEFNHQAFCVCAGLLMRT